MRVLPWLFVFCSSSSSFLASLPPPVPPIPSHKGSPVSLIKYASPSQQPPSSKELRYKMFKPLKGLLLGPQVLPH
ncbi:hypothetical protein E2C01_080621 [Portunus trituberculatus]|uniref:Secreted protein n=1 Tax=Portunus trituberculatus TaxID=210409 RepID=A0A5B7J028_PORTR|nr:hypothetical protein [Portunus trituberculatus]